MLYQLTTSFLFPPPSLETSILPMSSMWSILLFSLWLLCDQHFYSTCDIYVINTSILSMTSTQATFIFRFHIQGRFNSHCLDLASFAWHDIPLPMLIQVEEFIIKNQYSICIHMQHIFHSSMSGYWIDSKSCLLWINVRASDTLISFPLDIYLASGAVRFINNTLSDLHRSLTHFSDILSAQNFSHGHSSS